MTASPDKRDEIAKILSGVPFARVGVVTVEPVLALRDGAAEIRLPVAELAKAYQATFKNI